MAPTVHAILDEVYRRQTASVPTCVTTCMANGDIGTCASRIDYKCLCASSAYLSSVASCWASSCTADETAVGQTYAANSCAAFGVTIPGAGSNSTTTSGTAASNDTAVTTSSEVRIATATTTVLSTQGPVLYQKAFVDVQAIMSSICGALLLVSIFLGVYACYNKIKREREFAQSRTWTGVSTVNGPDTKGVGKSAFGFSRNGGTSTRDGTGTDNYGLSSGSYGVKSSNFGVTSSNFGGSSYTPRDREPVVSFGGRGINRERTGVNRGFTNRLTLNELNEMDGAGEEWEMSTKGSPGKEMEIESVMDESPTTSTRAGNSEIELGSTVHLTPKMDQESRMGRAV